MLSDFAIHPSLATSDVARARKWYSEMLGLEPLVKLPRLLAYQVGGTIFTVFETPAAGTAQNTVAIWGVDDVRAEIARLRRRGVAFEDVDLGPDGRTEEGILTTSDPVLGTALNAWFRDGDGNWISVVQQSEHPDDPPTANGWIATL